MGRQRRAGAASPADPAACASSGAWGAGRELRGCLDARVPRPPAPPRKPGARGLAALAAPTHLIVAAGAGAGPGVKARRDGALAGQPAPGAAAPRLAGLQAAAGAHLLRRASGPLAAGQHGGCGGGGD